MPNHDRQTSNTNKKFQIPMLPLFQIITPNSPRGMSINEVPVKPRRKKLDVPVHKVNNQQEEHKEPTQETKTRRTYAANFHSKRHKLKLEKYNASEIPHGDNFTEVVIEVPESDRPSKISKRHLNKEIQRLSQENEDLILKFNELEELSVKKITKLKEKINSLQNYNAELLKESNYIKENYEELLMHFDDAKNKLELSKHCKSCDDLKLVVEKASDDNKALRSRNNELNEDLEMMKTVVYRLNVHLERYQEKLRKCNIKPFKISLPAPNSPVELTSASDPNISSNILSEGHQGHRHTPLSWGSVNAHTLGPLLDAYQDAVNEKDELIQNYEVELNNFTGKLKQIIEENETLRRKLNDDDNCSSKLKVELTNLRVELKSLKEQNDLLIKKCAMKQDKIEEILKCYEAKVEQLKRDYTVVHEQYFKCRSEIAALKEKNKALTDAQDEFKNERQSYIPVSVHTASVNECKKWYEELKLQYQNEKQKLKETIESQLSTINDLNNKILSLNAEKDDWDGKIKLLEKQIKKSESKYLELDHTLSEVQLSRSACRKQLHKAMSFAKDMVTEQETLLKALNERRLETKAVKRIGSDMASKMDSLKNQLKDVQKNAWQEFTTVEQKIQEQADLIESMKQEHVEEIERLQSIIKEQEQSNLLLKSDNIPLPHYLLFRDKHK